VPYDEHRRATAVPRLAPVTKNEAAEPGSELRRTQAYERAREAIADEVRAQQAPKRRFADLVKKK